MIALISATEVILLSGLKCVYAQRFFQTTQRCRCIDYISAASHRGITAFQAKMNLTFMRHLMSVLCSNATKLRRIMNGPSIQNDTSMTIAHGYFGYFFTTSQTFLISFDHSQLLSIILQHSNSMGKSAHVFSDMPLRPRHFSPGR